MQKSARSNQALQIFIYFFVTKRIMRSEKYMQQIYETNLQPLQA